MRTSFPFLAVARETGFPYAEILLLADRIDAGDINDKEKWNHPACRAVRQAMIDEDDRRDAIIESAIAEKRV